MHSCETSHNAISKAKVPNTMRHSVSSLLSPTGPSSLLFRSQRALCLLLTTCQFSIAFVARSKEFFTGTMLMVLQDLTASPVVGEHMFSNSSLTLAGALPNIAIVNSTKEAPERSCDCVTA